MRLAGFVLAVLLMAGCAPAPAPTSAPAPAGQSASPPEKLILTEYTAAGLKNYLADVGSIGHGYFAVAVDGADYFYWQCPQIACVEIRGTQRKRALDDCRKESGGVDCVILAENQDVILDYQTYPIPLPPLDPADVPASQAPAGPKPPAPPADQLAKAGHPGWTVDQLHGCWIWNLNPDSADEVVTWTGACAADGTATGVGVLEWKDVERYIGPMQAGRKEGQGKKINAWGEAYAGGFKNGEHDGQGAYRWSDGSHYEGNYKDGYADGFGTFTERGEVYRGEWKNGCFDDGKKKYRILKRNIPGCTLSD